ncbi:MAG: 4Fe-4S dicluster domain-containing protein [Spirochaeta sp.]|nr:4Fe-4S dicluster domain-containing protein [Spirochaeta sp.]
MSAQRRTFRIMRGGGPAGSPAALQTYSLELNEHATVLDALEWIRVEQAPDLMYRHSCHHGSCGTCGMMINGKPKLACLTKVDNLASNDIKLEPLVGMEPLGDLVVSPVALMSAYPDNSGYIRESEVNNDAPRPQALSQFERFENCIECGLCMAACPVDEEFQGPAVLAALNRELAKTPERRAEILHAAGRPDGVYRCARALECSRVCPTAVYPAKHIMELRKELEKESSAK